MSSATTVRPITWPRARSVAAEQGTTLAHDLGPERLVQHLPLDAAHGSTLAVDLVADIDLPGVDTAAMDGYAVRGTGPWTVTGRILAGADPTVASLAPSQAVEVATGARVPDATDSVLPYERAQRLGEHLTGSVEPGRHVRRRGEDITAGTTVLEAGAVVTPAVQGLAASLARDTLAVRRPEVCLLMTGDEVRPSGTPDPGQVRDAIGPQLPGLVSWAGGQLVHQLHVPDSRAELGAALAKAQAETRAAVLVVAGASSAGPADHLRTALRELGAEILVDGVACRPGHPQLLARLPASAGPPALVVGLPGNPYAALAAGVTLLVPALATCAGRADATRHPQLELPVHGEIPVHERDTRLVAVRVRQGAVHTVGDDRPANLRGVAAADALAVVPPAWSGPNVDLLWLPR